MANLAHQNEIDNNSVTFTLVDSRSNPAWHSAANKVWDSDSETPSISEIMDSAHLSNWNMRLENIADQFTQHNFLTDSYLVVRDNPFNAGETDVLATVGSRYKIVQNEDLFSFAQNLHDSNPDVKIDSAGSFKGGRVVFGSWSIPNQLVLDPNGANDKTNLYLVVFTSHDGSVAVQAAITPVRVRCQNTLNLAMRNAKQSFKIRHTATVEGKIASAREALGLSVAYFDELLGDGIQWVKNVAVQPKQIGMVHMETKLNNYHNIVPITEKDINQIKSNGGKCWIEVDQLVPTIHNDFNHNQNIFEPILIDNKVIIHINE